MRTGVNLLIAKILGKDQTEVLKDTFKRMLPPVEPEKPKKTYKHKKPYKREIVTKLEKKIEKLRDY